MNEITLLVFGVAGILLLVSFLPPLAHRLALPDTVLLAGLGCALGIAIGLAGPQAESAEHPPLLLAFLAGLGELPLSSHMFLAVFLPILLFETALRLDARALLQDLAPVLVMAVVAVIVTTAVAGSAVWLVAGPPLAAGLLVAAIIATTDPVAVVAVFREVGAPPRLTALVEGESLLNDAAAIALFVAIMQVIVGTTAPEPLHLLADFAWDFAGGAAFGAVAGRLAAFTLSRLDGGGPAEVTLSVALAYLSYALAEGYLGVSGVVAVVLAGLVYGDAARARLSAEAFHTLHAIWGQVAFWASSLIFVLASTLVPQSLREADPRDGLLLAALIVGALLARALVLFGVLPIAVGRAGGGAVTRDHKLVMWWGGLRGAVTLALALGVRDDPAVPPAIQHMVSVLATGFVLFTLLVQATTLRWLIRALGLDQLSPLERLLRRRALELTRTEIEERLRRAAGEYGLPPPAPAALADTAPLPAVDQTLGREQLASALVTVTRREIELCVDQQTRGLVSRRNGARLIADARNLLDALRGEGLAGYRRVAARNDGATLTMRFAVACHRRLGIQRPLAQRLADRFARLLVRREVLGELAEFAASRIADLFGERVAGTAGRVIDGRRAETERGLDALRLQYPDYWRALSERHMTRLALRLEADGIGRMAHQGLLTAELERHLRQDMRVRERAIDALPVLDLGLRVDDLVRRLPLFASLSEARLTDIGRLLEPRLVLPGERVVRRGDPGAEMYFIASGAVEVVLAPTPVRLGTGEFFGEMALLTRQPRAADVMALGYCQLLALSRDDFDRFLETHPELVGEVRRIAAMRTAQNH
ncbi:MAG: cation:proton antiporter [Geminicoccaceae bacterium]